MDQVVDRATDASESTASAEGSAPPLPGIPLSSPQLREIGFHVCQDILEALQKRKDIDAAEDAAALGAHLNGEPLDWNATWMRALRLLSEIEERKHQLDDVMRRMHEELDAYQDHASQDAAEQPSSA